MRCALIGEKPLPDIFVEIHRRLEGVMDAVRALLMTRLGVPAENGLSMRAMLSLLSAEAFTGGTFAGDMAERLCGELLFKKRNIVLTGMPGTGKSEVGAALAEMLHRPLFDTDAEIVRRFGMPITEIFRTRGEPFFRDLESDVIRELSMAGGKVIATGGGAVLRRENVEAMRRNGTVVFLDRPVDELLPSDDRPLADTVEKVRALYVARHPIYIATADVTVPVRATPEATANAILERLR